MSFRPIRGIEEVDTELHLRSMQSHINKPGGSQSLLKVSAEICWEATLT